LVVDWKGLLLRGRIRAARRASRLRVDSSLNPCSRQSLLHAGSVYEQLTRAGRPRQDSPDDAKPFRKYRCPRTTSDPASREVRQSRRFSATSRHRNLPRRHECPPQGGARTLGAEGASKGLPAKRIAVTPTSFVPAKTLHQRVALSRSAPALTKRPTLSIRTALRSGLIDAARPRSRKPQKRRVSRVTPRASNPVEARLTASLRPHPVTRPCDIKPVPAESGFPSRFSPVADPSRMRPSPPVHPSPLAPPPADESHPA